MVVAVLVVAVVYMHKLQRMIAVTDTCTAAAYLTIACAKHCGEAVIVVWRSISVVSSNADLLYLLTSKIT
jgi:hypothetical protein